MSNISVSKINNFSIPSIAFRQKTANTNIGISNNQDSFVTNPQKDRFFDKNYITVIAKSNPNIVRILNENKIPLSVNAKELEELKSGHLKDTRVIAAKMYSALPRDMKEEVNLVDLQQAAILHDVGKALIPDKVLNKKGALNDKEADIMHLHSELSYELLKKQGINENTLNLIKYHHQNLENSGYPNINNGFKYDISAQILSTADKYSALTENRCYKKALSREEALKIIKEDVEKGHISEIVYDALTKSIS